MLHCRDRLATQAAEGGKTFTFEDRAITSDADMLPPKPVDSVDPVSALLCASSSMHPCADVSDASLLPLTEPLVHRVHPPPPQVDVKRQ